MRASARPNRRAGLRTRCRSSPANGEQRLSATVPLSRGPTCDASESVVESSGRRQMAPRTLCVSAIPFARPGPTAPPPQICVSPVDRAGCERYPRPQLRCAGLRVSRFGRRGDTEMDGSAGFFLSKSHRAGRPAPRAPAPARFSSPNAHPARAFSGCEIPKCARRRTKSPEAIPKSSPARPAQHFGIRNRVAAGVAVSFREPKWAPARAGARFIFRNRRQAGRRAILAVPRRRRRDPSSHFGIRNAAACGLPPILAFRRRVRAV